MAQQGPLGFMAFCGREVANAARTISYMRAGLANTQQGHWELGSGDVCSVLYRLNGGTCLSPDVFVSPAADPAPWYDASEPGSATFLGFVLLDLDGFDSTLTRTITDRLGGLGGNVFGGQRRKGRTWKFSGALISADDAGAEFGLRWLTAALQAAACDTCASCDLTVRLVCPPDDCSDDTLGEWTSYEVALTDGPNETAKFSPGTASMAGILAGCRDLVLVDFTMTAGNPFLYKREVACLAPTIIAPGAPDCVDVLAIPGGFYPAGVEPAGDAPFTTGAAGTPICCAVTPPARGTLGAVFTFQSVSGMGNVLLQAYEYCPGTGAETPTLQMELSGIPANSTVVVDCALRQISVADTATSASTPAYDGQYLLELQAGSALQWIEVRDCDTITCFCVSTVDPCSGGADTTVSISTQLREG